MALTEGQRASCAALADAWYWQLQERGKWRYVWHNEVLTRYYECAPLEADVFPQMLEYLQGQTGVTSIQLHGKRIELDGEWKAVRAWYETRDGDTSETNKLKRVRIYQALTKSCDGTAGDGPYAVENGCRYAVQHTFYWNVERLPTVSASSSGVEWRMLGVTRNDETGLWSCVIERRERVRQDVAEYVSEQTVFETKKLEQHLGVKQDGVASAGKQASVSDGTMVRRSVSKNEDCTSDVTNETVEEKAVSDAVTEKEEQLKGTVTTRLNRAQSDKAMESGLSVGSSVRNEKTPGGRWNQTVRTVTAKAVRALRRICRATLFIEEDSETESVTREPENEMHKKVQMGDGVTLERTVERNDSNGWDVTETTRKEKEVREAVTETHKFLDGIVKTTVNRSQKNKASEENLDVGDRVRNEKTDGGLWNQTIEKAEPKAVGGIAENCEESPLVHSHSTVEGVGNNKPTVEVESQKGEIRVRRAQRTERNAWDITDETRTAKEASETVQGGTVSRTVSTKMVRNAQTLGDGVGGTNVEKDVSGSINEFGLMDGVERTVTHRPDTKSARGGTANRTVEVESGINATSVSSSAGGTNKEVDVSVSPNEHGSMSYTKRTVTYNPAVQTATCGGPLVSETVESGINAETAPDGEGGDGQVVDVSVSPNEHGSMSYTKRTRSAKPSMQTAAWTTEDNNYTYTHNLVVFKNQNSVPNIPHKSYSCSVSVSINEYGLLDGTINSVTRAGGTAGGSGGSQADNRFKLEAYYIFRRADQKFYRQKFTCNCRYLRSTIDNMVAESSGGKSEPLVGWISGVKGSYALIYRDIQKEGEPQEYFG